MKSFVVLIDDDSEENAKKLSELAKKHNIESVPLTIFDGVAGPPKYKIAKDAETTVLLWKGRSVKKNHALAKGKLDKKATAAIVKDTAAILN